MPRIPSPSRASLLLGCLWAGDAAGQTPCGAWPKNYILGVQKGATTSIAFAFRAQGRACEPVCDCVTVD